MLYADRPPPLRLRLHRRHVAVVLALTVLAALLVLLLGLVHVLLDVGGRLLQGGSRGLCPSFSLCRSPSFLVYVVDFVFVFSPCHSQSKLYYGHLA